MDESDAGAAAEFQKTKYSFQSILDEELHADLIKTGLSWTLSDY